MWAMSPVLLRNQRGNLGGEERGGGSQPATLRGSCLDMQGGGPFSRGNKHDDEGGRRRQDREQVGPHQQDEDQDDDDDKHATKEGGAPFRNCRSEENANNNFRRHFYVDVPNPQESNTLP